MITIDFCNTTEDNVLDMSELHVQRLYNEALIHLDRKGDFEVSVTIVDNQKIQEINKTYRNIDRPTDVISFAFMDENEIIYPEGFPVSLGDIYISYNRAQEQAKEYGHSLSREMNFLALHGFLHLLGFNHETDEDEKIMFTLQDEILKTLEIGR